MMRSGQSVCRLIVRHIVHARLVDSAHMQLVISLSLLKQGEKSDHPQFLSVIKIQSLEAKRRRALFEVVEEPALGMLWCLMLVDIKFHHLSVENGDNVR